MVKQMTRVGGGTKNQPSQAQKGTAQKTGKNATAAQEFEESKGNKLLNKLHLGPSSPGDNYLTTDKKKKDMTKSNSSRLLNEKRELIDDEAAVLNLHR